MFSIWFVGFILVLAYRVFNAGMNSKTLLYRVSPYRSDNGAMIFDDGKAFSYAFFSFVVAIFWMAALPVIGVYKLGERLQREQDKKSDK